MKRPEKFEEITKAPDIGIKDLHPSPSAGGKFTGRDLPPYAGSDGEENKFFRCKQCGLVVNRRINPSGSGWGNETQESITTNAGGTAKAKNPIIGAGCPLCGSSEYE